VIFPQDIRNCRNCHDENDTTTPEAGNWIAKPTIEACGACHDTVNFATGENHFDMAPPVTNADCVNCHGQGQFAAADEVHRLLEQEAAEKYEYRILGATNTAVGEMPVATIQVVDPTNNDTPYNIKTDAPFVQPFGGSRLVVTFAWDTVDYTNVDSGSETPVQRLQFLVPAGSQAQPVSVNAVADSVDNADGTFNVMSPVAVSANTSGTLAVTIEGHPAEDVNDPPDGEVEELPVTSAVAFFAIDDATAVPRRKVVSLETCNACHQQLSLHGSNRTDNIDGCVTCHNPDATDIQARTEWAGANPGMMTPDGKKEEAVDFKHMIHAIHAGAVVVHGFAASVHDYTHVVFPAEKNTCTNCHDGNTFYPVNQNFVLATTVDTGASLATPTDDVNISPNASACWGCHRSDSVTPNASPDSAQSHMVLNGASFNATQALDGTLTDNDTMGTVVESCEICHGAGRSSDVAVVHGVE
jgi:OmcA/MtrC family decaheme c-type cytochrome